LDESVLQAFAATLVEVLDPEVVIHLAAAEEAVDDDQDRWPSATAAFFLPRRAVSRRYCAAR
jgi:hypothetical protein